jgi:hypothetical protein
MNHAGYVVQNPAYASWDMGGDHRLNGGPFTANKISNSKGTGYLVHSILIPPLA